jgi:hypothetical protein
MPYEKDMAKIYYYILNDNPWIFTVRLTATCNWWDPTYWGFVEEDSFILTLNWTTSNQAPTNISIDSDNIDENSATGSVVWNISTTDSDSTSFTYSLVDTVSYPDNSSFSIVYDELRINLSPDYETKNSYSIKIQTDDWGGWIYEKEFVININDIDETIASIDAWNNQNVASWSRVNLVWTLNWFPTSWCNYIYSWNTEDNRINIINSWSLDEWYFDTSFTWSNIEIWFEVKVSSTQMTHDSCWKTWIYNDNLFVTISDDSSTPVTHHHSSYSSRMRNEASKIFNNPQNIKLNLYENNFRNKYFYELWWKYIWWDGQIEYELQYSNTKSFEKYKKIKTKSRFHNFYKWDLEESEIYFFRLKAFYKNKESPYSNIVSIVNKENPLALFKVKCTSCNKKLYFWDVFQSVDLLLEDKFKIKCIWCKSNKLKYLYSDILLEENNLELNINKINSCDKKIDYLDIFNYKKWPSFKVKCTSNCNNKIIDYYKLLK